MSSRKSQPSRGRPSPGVALCLLLALLCGALPAQAQSRRERRVTQPTTPPAAPTHTPATPAATPRTPASPAPVAATPQTPPTQQPAASPIQTPAPNAPPAQTPTPEPTPLFAGAGARTVEELRARIQEVTRQPLLASSHLAVKIVSLDTGRVIYEENAGKWLQPASNLKLFTVAAALDRLTPEFRFTTSVYAPAPLDATGTVRGDLTIYGRGDPTFATRFQNNATNNGTAGGAPPDYFAAIDELAGRIHAAGVRRVEGDLVGDESYFTGPPLAPGWEWDDLQWYYGAEVSALTVNDNAVELTIRPGARPGDPCSVSFGPATPALTAANRATTSPRGTRRELRVYRPLGSNVIEISGTLPVDDRGWRENVAVPNPALMFVTMLRMSLVRRGVQIAGRTRTMDARAREAAPLPVSSLVEVASRQSPPLSLIAAQTLKPSQNLYTELILRALGKAATEARQTSGEAGVAAVKNFLRGAGVNADKILVTDGSGLSRSDLVTAEEILRLLVYMNGHRHAQVFREALPVAAVDGTLRNRMKGTPAAGNVRAKTGTLSSATSLAGYVTTAAGERLAFALMINNPPPEANPRAAFTDPIAVMLASFAGRT